jgi:hypothetical protein
VFILGKKKQIITYYAAGIRVQRRIATIKPYTARASARATTKKALKKVSSRSDKDEIAAVPTVLIAHALPKTAELTDIAAERAKTTEVIELNPEDPPVVCALAMVIIPFTLENTIMIKNN